MYPAIRNSGQIKSQAETQTLILNVYTYKHGLQPRDYTPFITLQLKGKTTEISKSSSYLECLMIGMYLAVIFYTIILRDNKDLENIDEYQ